MSANDVPDVKPIIEPPAMLPGTLIRAYNRELEGDIGFNSSHQIHQIISNYFKVRGENDTSGRVDGVPGSVFDPDLRKVEVALHQRGFRVNVEAIKEARIQFNLGGYPSLADCPAILAKPLVQYDASRNKEMTKEVVVRWVDQDGRLDYAEFASESVSRSCDLSTYANIDLEKRRERTREEFEEWALQRHRERVLAGLLEYESGTPSIASSGENMKQ
jgi:hypothetical protein